MTKASLQCSKERQIDKPKIIELAICIRLYMYNVKCDKNMNSLELSDTVSCQDNMHTLLLICLTFNSLICTRDTYLHDW